jgi:putative heme-binding domain-containing protein
MKKGPNEVRPALLQVANENGRPEDVRIAALAASDELPPDAFAFARDSVAPAKPLAVRSTAASVLARARLNGEQLSSLLPAVKAAGPLELSKLLAAFGRSKDEALGIKLLSALKDAAAFQSLRAENITTVLSNYPPTVRQQAQPLITSLNADAVREKQRIEEMFASMKPGDIRRGQALFNSEKTACVSCHAIGYVGGKVGPDLTRIGQIRTERDLLEAIVYPSASFVRSYEPMIVATKGGDEYSGVLRKDAPDEVVLVTGPNAEQHISRNEITEMRPGAVSVMPGGLAEQLSKDELADLVAFLRATRW